MLRKVMDFCLETNLCTKVENYNLCIKVSLRKMDTIEEEPTIPIYELSDREAIKETENILDSVNFKLTDVDTNSFEKQIEILKGKTSNLKEKIRKEKELWRKEIDETNQLQLQIAEINSKAMEVAQEQEDSASVNQLEDWLSKCSLIRVKSREYCLIDSSRNELQKQLNWHQGALVKTQSSRHLNLHRQMSDDIFKKKLLKVEQMCNIELARLRQSAAYLDPLKKMASEWKLSEYDNFQNPECSKSANFSVAHKPQINKISTDLDFSLSGIHSSPSNMKISHNCNAGESTEVNEFSLKMNANLKVAESQQTSVWKGDGIQESVPFYTQQECSTNNLDYIFKNSQIW